MNRPSFLCVGARNAGAGWLSRALREHPEVWLGPLDEHHYFNTLFGQEPASARRRIKLSLARALREHLAATPANHVDFAYVRYLSRIGDPSAMFTEAWYLDVFSGGAALTKGDITPDYCTIGEAAIDYVMRLLGSSPVIYLVRDPMERALSQVKARVRVDEDPPIRRAEWESFIDDPDVRLQSDYKTNITNWLAHYPNQRLLFVPYPEIVAKPDAVLRTIEKHIGVSAQANRPAVDAQTLEEEDVELPGFVSDMLREATAGQYSFLTTELGADFCARLTGAAAVHDAPASRP